MAKIKKVLSFKIISLAAVFIFLITGASYGDPSAKSHLRVPLDRGIKRAEEALPDTELSEEKEKSKGKQDNSRTYNRENVLDALPLIRAMGGLLYEKKISELIDNLDDYSSAPAVQVEMALLAAKLTDDERKLEVIEKYLVPYISKPALEAITQIALTMSDDHKKDICDRLLLPGYELNNSSTRPFLIELANIIPTVEDDVWKKEKVKQFGIQLNKDGARPWPEIPYIIRKIAPTLKSDSDSYKSDIIYGTGEFRVGLRDVIPLKNGQWLSTRGEAIEAIAKTAATFPQDAKGDALKLAVINDILAIEFVNADDYSITEDSSEAIADVAVTLSAGSYNEKIRLIYDVLMAPDEKGIIYGGAQPAVGRIASTLSEDDAKTVIKDRLLPMFLQNLMGISKDGLFQGDPRQSANAIAKVAASLALDKDKFVYIEELKKGLMDSNIDPYYRTSCIDGIAIIAATLTNDTLKLDIIDFLKSFDVDGEGWDVREDSWDGVGKIGLSLDSEAEIMSLVIDFEKLRVEGKYFNYLRPVDYISELSLKLTEKKDKREAIEIMRNIITDTYQNFYDRMLIADTIAVMAKTLQNSVGNMLEEAKNTKTDI